jgi:hypothetical protein
VEKIKNLENEGGSLKITFLRGAKDISKNDPF